MPACRISGVFGTPTSSFCVPLYPTYGTIGNPRGFLEGTVSDGIISGIRGAGNNKLLQMTAPISPGSSGGPVLNTNAEVIGIAAGDYSLQDPTLKINRSQNLNVAIPSNYLKALLREVE